jgi:hypothetical protein
MQTSHPAISFRTARALGGGCERRSRPWKAVAWALAPQTTGSPILLRELRSADRLDRDQ